MISMKKIILILVGLLLIFNSFGTVHGQTVSPTPAPSSTAQDLQNKINELQSKINDLQGQEKTLSDQISVYDNQIKLTTYKIQQAKQQIADLTLDIDTASKKIENINSSLDNLTKVLYNRIRATYEIGSAPSFQVLVASNDVTDFVERAKYLRLAQQHDKRLIYDTVQAKNDYANQKNIFEEEKKRVQALNAQLLAYNQQLDQQKGSKQQLLSETQGSEANYQRILAQTKAQLASFQGFVSSQGGSSLLGNQTVCDDWGCYYNQRDSQWGGNSLNGTGYTLADSGCLVTSMAMMYTHYGHRDINPQSINSNSSNFSGIPAALLKFSITANGVGADRQRISSVDSGLSSGPVIVGISYDGGPYSDHFLVLISGSSGNYQMNDPYTAGGHNIPFTSHYSVGSIREIYTVSVH